jgi:hypothetical protein
MRAWPRQEKFRFAAHTSLSKRKLLLLSTQHHTAEEGVHDGSIPFVTSAKMSNNIASKVSYRHGALNG